MAVLFLIFLDQICPKWIKLDQIGFPHQSKNVPIKICHIYRKDKNGCFVFDFFWIRSVQNGSNLIKLDFSPIKNVTIKSCHIYHEDKNGYFIFDIFGSHVSKMELKRNHYQISKMRQGCTIFKTLLVINRNF